MLTSAIILSIVILAVVLVSDLGRRAVTGHRLKRPLITAGIAGATFLSAFATSGTGLAIEIAGIAAGAVLGLAVAGLMKVDHDTGEGQVFTNAGAAYAGFWALVIALRLAFIYGSSHWFSHSLGSWMYANHVTQSALTDALVLMALAMTSARTISLIVRSRLAAEGASARAEALGSIG